MPSKYLAIWVCLVLACTLGYPGVLVILGWVREYLKSIYIPWVTRVPNLVDLVILA